MVKDNEREYVGDISQLFEVKEYRMLSGKADGMRCVDIDNGNGLDVTVLADRGMDIGRVSFKGVNMCFMSPCGYVAPQYYSENNADWLKSFTAGMMTTCGLTNVGSPCTDDGEFFGLHGRIANIPAEQFGVRTEYTQDGPSVNIRGVMRHGWLFHENLCCTRQIKISRSQNKIAVRDHITNIGYKTTPFMMLYHCNIGYPVLDEDCRIAMASYECRSRDEHAESGFKDRFNITAPEDNYAEMCYYHKMKHDDQGLSGAAVYQPKKDVGVAIWFGTDKLDHFTQWKMLGKGEYVLGLEPANVYVGGRTESKQNNDLKYIKPGECITHELTFQYFCGNEWDEIKGKIEAMGNV